MRNKLFASCLLMTGIFSLLSGIALPAFADLSCRGFELIIGTECDPAHAIHRDVAELLNVNCHYIGGQCIPVPGSQCGLVSGYQQAGRGLCVVTLETSGQVACIEDIYSTFIPLQFYTTQCGIENGGCTCMYIRAQGYFTQYAEVCDCSE